MDAMEIRLFLQATSDSGLAALVRSSSLCQSLYLAVIVVYGIPWEHGRC